MKRIFLIIGGPGFGKTRLAEGLEEKGYYIAKDCCTPQFFRQCIASIKTRDTNSRELNLAVIKARVKQYHEAPEDRLCFFDRGIPDTLAYLEEFAEEFLDIAKSHPYENLVFVTPPWREIHETHFGRLESFSEACSVHERLVATYAGLGYNLVELPKASVQARVEFVESMIKE
jgi:predicted ATPase